MSELLPWLDDEDLSFPEPATALRFPDGLLAVGGDLRPERLLRAYQLGIFPWYEEGQPPLWWSPDPRMVLFPDELHISRSMEKFLRRQDYRIETDTDFAGVLAGCAAPRPGSKGTWISTEMQQAYLSLHRLGHAHSIEIRERGELVGGLYGIAMGRIFFGESMFSRRDNVSKLALVVLAAVAREQGYRLIDCQVANPHLESLGARLVSRDEFARYLPAQEDVGRRASWPYNMNWSPNQ